MNIYEAYQELKKGKFVRAKDACGTVFFAVMTQFLSESAKPIVFCAISEHSHTRPLKIALCYPSIYSSIETLEDIDREFESFTEDELLKRLQEEFDERQAKMNKVKVGGETVTNATLYIPSLLPDNEVPQPTELRFMQSAPQGGANG